MNWRSLPPLAALRAFAAFAQTRNIVAAGEALGVSHAAVSQQLRALEQQMEVPLLDRSGRAMALTVAGERLALALRSGFGQMIEAVEELTGQQEGRPLHISVTPSFAASWLMPRLPRFRAAYPEIDLMIDPSPAVVSLETGGIDVAIRYGTGPWPGVDAEMLVSSPLVVVAAPSLVGHDPIGDLNQLSEFPWLEEFGTTEATRWLRRFGVPLAKAGMVQLPGNFMLDGARDGHGVAVTVREFVARDIAAGRLRELYAEEMPGTGYQIVTRKGVPRKWVKAFVAWLRREARQNAVSPDQS